MLTPIDYFRKTIAEGRMIQGAWQREVHGKHYVCLAAAWGKPGTITSVYQCPVSLFPKWVFELMPLLDDGVAACEVPWLFQQFGERADKMAALTPDQWENLRTSFCVAVMDFALEKAAACQPSPAPDYWKGVVNAHKLVKAALSPKETSAAESAWLAAKLAAKSAAKSAAELAAWSAAESAWSAARSAAWSAAESAWLAAWSAAYKEIASLLFVCIDSI
jgi:hypothetical protein